MGQRTVTAEPSVDHLGRHDSWEGVHAVVAGLGASGYAAADALVQVGARVTILDDGEGDLLRERAGILEVLGAEVRLGPGATATLPAGAALLVPFPGLPPRTPIVAEAAQARDVAVWSEPELAWRLREPGAAPWLAVTGTNGKTTTVQMLESILAAAGLRAPAVGNIGVPVTEAVMDPAGYDVLAVELSSFQLHFARSLACEASAVLNVADDHLDWHGGPADYARDKGRIYEHVERACVYNVDDPATERLVRDADVQEGARAIGFTLGVPSVGMVGMVDDVLADRAFVPERTTSAAELATLGDLAGPAGEPPAPHVVANALAAAALARAHGVPPVAVRDGLRAYQPGAHRIQQIAEVDGVTFVDDSKATNPHAAIGSLLAYPSVVWVAGGQAKGTTFDGLVERTGSRLRAAVLIGADRAVIRDALRRHAPEVPVVEVDAGKDVLMDRVVDAAVRFARPGDTVLLAPGCASLDQFTSYAERGDSFAAAVARHAATRR
ncbi:UDP-N-acetylmuramoyl-L-alanine--D-glutamate ligase [Mumia sp. zg.B21]|uniref:UDP-N-acetylmuramoyl-L-alanine--D-glutamate ligase n=1 Tax=Mumia sp. zg.B21 TaxID=2855447 RepID=UPI0035AE196E